MKSTVFAILSLSLLLLANCSSDNSAPPANTNGSFKMGFTTWSYGPNLEDVDNTYLFIANNANIYAEHVDNSIPWDAWINDLLLPEEFTNEISGRANRKISGMELLLSVSILNLDRNDLATDMDGSTPSYTSIDDTHIKNAYYRHINYLVSEFDPDYLVIAIEANELRLNAPEKWDGYTNLIAEVKTKIRQDFPGLKISESISIHNVFESEAPDATAYTNDIIAQMNLNDFVAISFYPFLKNLSSKTEMQEVFDFLHTNVTPPIAFVETSHIAEDLVIPNLNVSIAGNESGQNDYLEVLLENAATQDYEFIIWWAHRDFDALWETFPAEVKDLGQIWRDTGLLDENGTGRPAFTTWSGSLQN